MKYMKVCFLIGPKQVNTDLIYDLAQFSTLVVTLLINFGFSCYISGWQ